MGSIKSSEVIDAFEERLLGKGDEVAKVASFWNSFEGWLKFELALALWGLGFRPWSENDEVGTVGLEYKAPLLRRLSAGARKQIDLWVSTNTNMDTAAWHAVELKVAFKNANSVKQIASWLRDFDVLQGIDDPNASSAIALLIAVGFEKPNLRDRLVSEGVRGHEVRWIADAVSRGTPSVALVALAKFRPRRR